MENSKTNADLVNTAIDLAIEKIVDKPAVAVLLLKQVLNCDPNNLKALQYLGISKNRMGENTEAIEIFNSILDKNPNCADTLNNLSLCYTGLGEQEKAIECNKKAIELMPDNFMFKNNLALKYRSLGKYEESISLIEKAIKLNPDPQLWINLGGIYGELKELNKAQECFEKAIRLEPNCASAYVDLSFVYHLKGDWKKGFAAYEWRFLYFHQLSYYLNSYDQKKLWKGDKSLKNKKILIYGEQGIGDQIQFIRYIKNLKELGAYVIVHCSKPLEILFKRIKEIDKVFIRDIVNNIGEEFPEYDYQCSMMSLPYLLGVEQISGDAYLEPATLKFIDSIKKDYSETFNVGIVWAGSAAHPFDKNRSFSLKNFKEIQNLEKIKLFSLQLENTKRKYGFIHKNESISSPKSLESAEIVDFSEGCEDIKLVDLTKMIESVEDTATILAGLDLVICCDTAIAHLAGAMGKPVWVVLPYNPDWRWGINGSSTDWYNSMRIYRKTERNDWSEVFEKIKKDLHETVLQNK